jgi:hypothetical protein
LFLRRKEFLRWSWDLVCALWTFLIS